MGYNGQDRRASTNEPRVDRRKDPNGRPPPGTVVDRRLGIDRRNLTDPRANRSENEQPVAATEGQTKAPHTKASTDEDHSGLERRRGRGRRLSDFTKSAEEGEMNTEQFLFLMAIDGFKKANDKMFPTWTDVLEVIRLLGYRKTMPSELNLTNAEDWLERSDAEANVRPQRWAERFEDGPDVGKRAAGYGANPNKSEKELTDEALEAFEAAFGNSDSEGDLDSELNDAA